MEGFEPINLRGHHLVSLGSGCDTDFYRSISRDPSTLIRVVNGSDDRCAVCSHNIKNACALWSHDQLCLEDERSLATFFPTIHVGDMITVEDVCSMFDTNYEPKVSVIHEEVLGNQHLIRG
ncbi:hypothetical protein GF362_07035 [Candidatus Dojkabacteria bacterium]|nr:hypothetical protein [Candidatus Dojkabacteria bacterium]